jgi:GH15 family glucan-1,4-alpha-glucosidase
VRIVEGLEGELPVELSLAVRFGYGADLPWITPCEGGAQFVSGGEAVVLRGPVPVGFRDKTCTAYIQVKKGDRLAFQLTWYPSEQPTPEPIDAERALAETEAYWREWSGRCRYEGPWRDAVMRSLLTLKACTYAPTGGIVAAPTTSLPESIGSVRNWDYRFCWLRDASLTLDALLIGGYIDEARGFRDWLLRTVAGAPESVQIMYGIQGQRRLTEFDVPWLPGYEGSRPVRVGNAASEQFQLDVFGEVLSCLYAGRKRGLAAASEGWAPMKAVIEHVERVWQMPDDGIWEVRGGRRHFTHSKMMAWVAIDRAVRSIEEMEMGGDDGKSMLPHLRAVRERIHAEVCDRGFNPRVGAFTQSYGSEVMDASILVMPHVGFLPASDPRVAGTVAAVERTLLRDGFVLRYDPTLAADGLPGTEGAFLACSFWLADNYAFAGRLSEAEEMFGKLLALRNPLGLLSEEYDPRLQRLISNFPQAFSHLALVLTAWLIDHARRGDLQALGTGAAASEQLLH